MYKNVKVVKKIAQLVNKYISILKFENFVKKLSKYLMKVFMKYKYESKISTIKLKVYPLNNNAYQFINKIFNRIYYQS